MLERIFSFQFGGFYGGDIGYLLANLEQLGFFSYVLPFLLIFALVFGILMKTNIFKDNKAINAVIALVIGLLALQFHFVPIFFSEIFPRVGVGLAVILALLVLAGLFFDPKSKFTNYFLLITGVIIFLVVIAQSFAWAGGYWGWYLYDNWPRIIGIAIVLGLIAVIWNSVGPRKDIPEYQGFWTSPNPPNPPRS